MNEKEKQEYLDNYHAEKEKGVPFFPDIIFKDTVVVVLVFLVLIALAYFKGAPLEARANPADSTYTPRPEWYFLFLFQLLKYFPGKLEFVGVVVIPTLAILTLFFLPFLDRSSKRYFTKRPWVNTITLVGVVGVIFLTVQSIRETPPPAEATGGDEIATLYIKNCSGCHGATVQVSAGTNLHSIIAQGRHEGMPAWSADLTSDQIDALAGFILSPGGSQLFTTYCGACHEVSQLVASDPVKLKSALGSGPEYPPHQGLQVPDWSTKMTTEEQTRLLNFLGAPDGQRLFTINCSPCHGRFVAFSGDKEELRNIISKGGMHLDMPSWREKLNDADLQLLAQYVVDPASASDAQKLFKDNCAVCHGDRVPKIANINDAYQAIASGGSHQIMPIWGNVLTPEQLDALVNYTFDAKSGTSLDLGQQLYETNCSPCHGRYGEGGPNPSRPSSIISPISSSEFLKTRDDSTLWAIISQGQPNQGMSPFGNAGGGPLDDDQINAIVAYIRSWEGNPPVEVPPQVSAETLALKGAEIYKQICAQCHGDQGQGNVGPALNDPGFQSSQTDQAIFAMISQGHGGTSMIAWDEILTVEQINQLVAFIRQFPPPQISGQPTPTPKPAKSTPTFDADILPIFQQSCTMCHGTLGGWDSTTYQAVMTSGVHGPVVIPGDPINSLLAQKLQGTFKIGGIMPPSGELPDETVKIILDWIAAGAPEK